MKERNSCNCAIIQSLEESVNLRIPLLATNQDEGMIYIFIILLPKDSIAKIIKSFVLSSCSTVESANCNENNNTKSRLSSEVIVVQIEVHCPEILIYSFLESK